MRKHLPVILLCVLGFTSLILNAQDGPLSPSIIGVGKYHGLTPPLSELPTISLDEFAQMALDADKKRNEELRIREYPYAETALPKGPDEAWQKMMGTYEGMKAPIVNFDGQTSPYYPPDDNGTSGPNHYMQTINTVYAIYSKTGTLVAGPTNMNLLFSGVTGATCNDGDPLILYDEQAARWLAVEFSICGANDYMLVAVSQTNDPTGSWHRYSFDVADMPDYEKFGIWQDGYYMGSNNSAGNDIYVFQRSQMLTGGTAQFVGFDNAWRPTTIDGFMCVPPVDNDGAFAPAGSPGLFITMNDDAIAGGTDQLWIYELAVNWTTPASSTFTRTQQLAVTAFDSNFGANWDNIKQPGTTRELDAIPQVIMNAPQYRNFGTYQTIVCCHTVDVDNTDHAGIRWYELRKTTGTWSVRQTGTYAPDGHSRWMGSIRLNGYNEIGLGYSVSSTSVYPSIRYAGQSSTAYTTGAGTLDVAEQTIQTGAYSQTAYNRWGDYSSIAIDPTDDKTFWYTNQYMGSTTTKKTRIASFQISAPVAAPDLIVQSPAASPTSVLAGATTTASCTVKNQGTATAGASNLKYYLSSNTTYEVGDTYLALDAVASLAASATAAVSELVTIPAGTTAGTWYILFYADADLAVTESSETNNVGYVAITVTSGTSQPDLITQSPAASPTSVVAGSTTTASCTVKNQGTATAAASTLKYYLSANSIYEVSDTYLISDAVASLAANGTAAVSELVTIPSATAAGTYYILFFTDADAVVAESNETNNVGYIAITVTVASSGCNSTTQYPSSTLTPTTAWKTQNSVWAGEYCAFNVVSGRTYNFSLCSTDGASATYDSELTLRNKATDAYIAYSDDYCGDDAKVIWTATFTGVVKLVVTQYSCATGTTNTKVRYKYTAKEAELPNEIIKQEFSIYPNPTNAKFYVAATTDFDEINEIQVYDSKGALQVTEKVVDPTVNEIEISLGNFPQGVYYIRVIGSNSYENLKVMKTN
jgi:subtilase family serine protease